VANNGKVSLTNGSKSYHIVYMLMQLVTEISYLLIEELIKCIVDNTHFVKSTSCRIISKDVQVIVKYCIITNTNRVRWCYQKLQWNII